MGEDVSEDRVCESVCSAIDHTLRTLSNIANRTLTP